MLDLENILKVCIKCVFRNLNTTCTTFRQYCVFRAWSGGYIWQNLFGFWFHCFLCFCSPLSCLIVPLALHIHWLHASSKSVDSPSLCKECTNSLVCLFLCFFFLKKLFLLIYWTLRGECTFSSDQCPSNSYLKESHRKPWSSYKNLDCLLFIRFTRTLVFGYQDLLEPPTVLSPSPCF